MIVRVIPVGVLHPIHGQHFIVAQGAVPDPQVVHCEIQAIMGAVATSANVVGIATGQGQPVGQIL